MDASRFLTATLRRRPEGGAIASIMATAVAAADPYEATARNLALVDNVASGRLRVGSSIYDLAHIERILLLSVGKAATPMAHAALDILRDRITDGLVVPKAASGEQPRVGDLSVTPSAHPIPDARSIEAGEQALTLMQEAGAGDLVLVLLSGGGSALMTAPDAGMTLQDMRSLTDALLASGATINEINALRRRCDRVKGGGLLRAAYPARVAVLVLSDVLGDDLQAIASGPFVAREERTDAQEIVRRYELHERLPRHILDLLAAPSAPFDPALAAYVEHTIVANLAAAVDGASHMAHQHGYTVDVLDANLQGEASAVGLMLAQRLLATNAAPRGQCLLAGGETTVTLQGTGLGGRNQEQALSAVRALHGHPDLVFVALATDGGDGPTDAAGAVVDGTTYERGMALGLDPDDFLRRNDAYHYFAALDDLLKPGPTDTNVNDITLLFRNGDLQPW